MQIIIKRSENRFPNFLAFLFMVGLGAIPLWLAGGHGGWAFFLLFVLFSLLPLTSVIQPKTSLLATENSHLIWWTAQQGKRIEEASVPIDAIRKVIKRSCPGSRFVEIQLVLADNTVLPLPQGLLPEVNSKKIIGGVKGLSQAIEFEERDEAQELDVHRPKHPNGRQTRFTEKNVWKFTLGFLIVGVALVVTAVLWGISTYRFVQAASTADGTIQKINLVGNLGHPVYQPTVVFTDRSGQVQIFTEPGGENPPGFKVGQRVRVAYDANNPSDARIVAFRTLWLGQTIIGVLGMFFAVIGSLTTWKARKLFS